MCDAAWCAPCAWAPLRWLCLLSVRYSKCLTLTFSLYLFLIFLRAEWLTTVRSFHRPRWSLRSTKYLTEKEFSEQHILVTYDGLEPLARLYSVLDPWWIVKDKYILFGCEVVASSTGPSNASRCDGLEPLTRLYSVLDPWWIVKDKYVLFGREVVASSTGPSNASRWWNVIRCYGVS